MARVEEMYKRAHMETVRKQGFYEKIIKRALDLILSSTALIVLSPLLVILTVTGCVKMKGNPFFTQLRPGYNEQIFALIKFRTMTNAKDRSGRLLPDEKRLTSYGKFLRASSLDELPELINIIKGDMSIIGPRPQLVRDMVFMSGAQRMRHSARPGLSGLAQVKGRNAITWDEKLDWDLKYIAKISFAGDLAILLDTISAVLSKEPQGTDLYPDYGDELLRDGKISKEYYDRKMAEAERLMKAARKGQ